MNQKISNTNAGILIVKKIMKGTKTNTFALGKKCKYAPKTPAIDPEAPIIGIFESKLKIDCESDANTPQAM